MKWIEFANEYEKVIDDLIGKDRKPLEHPDVNEKEYSTKGWTETSKEVREGRAVIRSVRELPKERQEVEISKCKARHIKELFSKLKAKA